MSNKVLIWVFVFGVIVTVFVAFNYQGSRDSLSLSEIFPDEESYPVDIEYEFIDEKVQQEQNAKIKREIESVKEVAAVKQVNNDIAKQDSPVPTSAVTQVDESKESLQTVQAQAVEQKNEVKSADVVPGSFSIQVASFKTTNRANASLKNVSAKGFQGYVKEVNLGEKGVWHRVYVGPFSKRAEANSTLLDVKKHFDSGFVILSK